MGERTRSRAREQLKGVVNRIAYPEAWPDLSALRVASDNWPANAARAAAFHFDREIERIEKPAGRTEWRGRVTAAEASSDPGENTLTIPAGLIHPPFYDFWIDDAANFGAIGTIIGRRLADVVIGNGSRFDSEGNLNSAAPASARVNGPLSNMREFRQAFECPEGTPMARKAIDSCEVW